jgi:hypothetical protein
MDKSAVPMLLLIPIVIVVLGYVLAWRGKSAERRRAGNLMVSAITGLIALFGSWWALGMTYGLLSDSHSEGGSLTVDVFFLALGVLGFVLIWPVGAWYLCIRFGKMALGKDQPSSTTNL